MKFNAYKIEPKALNKILGGEKVKTKTNARDKKLFGITGDEHDDKNNNGIMDEGDTVSFFFQ